MNTFLRVIACVAALTLLTAGAALATHGNPDQALPISGWTFGTDTITAPSADCQVGEARYEHSGTGYVAHLGAVDVVVAHCSRFTSETTGSAGPGTMTMTAADGDRLFFTESATFELTTGPSGPVSNIHQDWQVTGGTGRFAHATGSGSGSGLSLLALGTTSMTYRGTIVYDAADRAGD
jgi:hypothetical protein